VSIENFGSKANSRGFQKGVSGNPGGRPKGLERTVREAIARREFTDANGVVHKGLDAVFARLLEMLLDRNTSPRDAVALAKEIIDRGFGKAKQFVEVTDGNAVATDGRPASDMTEDEVREALAAIGTLKRLGGITADADDDPTQH
jgi:hypothetical protein